VEIRVYLECFFDIRVPPISGLSLHFLPDHILNFKTYFHPHITLTGYLYLSCWVLSLSLRLMSWLGLL